ncbi:MAG: lysophospholipid acyltransferase family protein [Candidatus Binatia bacterium]
MPSGDSVPGPRPALPISDQLSLALQRGAGWLSSPLWAPAVAALQGLVMGWTIADLDAVRAAYRRVRSEPGRPLLVCANHLTLVDSAIIAWALGSPASYVWDYGSLPWNLPESRNFATNPVNGLLVYLMKCIPITRSSSGEEVGRALAKIAWLLRRGETALVFPEGGRGRTGRIDVAAGTYGAGRIVNAVGGCRVLCVYLRGEGQETWSDLPARGERFRVLLDCFEPASARKGLRGSLDVTRQILERLAALEARYFDDR